MNKNIESVLVIGFGTMGQGIVKTFAINSFKTSVLTRNPSQIKDLPANVFATAVLPATPPDLVVESIPEDINLKHQLFEQLEDAYGGISVLATNTSGLPIDQIASQLRHKKKFLSIHYMQPAEAFPLVEVCCLNETSKETLKEGHLAH